MSHVPIMNPFGSYIEQHLASLRGKIEEWLTGFGKTMDDVVWWEMTSEPLPPYQFMLKIYIRVSFAGSEEKFKETFIWNTMEEGRK